MHKTGALVRGAVIRSLAHSAARTLGNARGAGREGERANVVRADFDTSVRVGGVGQHTVLVGAQRRDVAQDLEILLDKLGSLSRANGGVGKLTA